MIINLECTLVILWKDLLMIKRLKNFFLIPKRVAFLERENVETSNELYELMNRFDTISSKLDKYLNPKSEDYALQRYHKDSKES